MNRRDLWDPRAFIAFISVCGAFGLQAYMIATGEAQEMPAWVVGLVSAVVAYYYGARNGKGLGDPRYPGQVSTEKPEHFYDNHREEPR